MIRMDLGNYKCSFSIIFFELLPKRCCTEMRYSGKEKKTNKKKVNCVLFDSINNYTHFIQKLSI